MNEFNDKNLQSLAVPTVSMKSHQVHLKQALLAASRTQNKSTNTRWSNLMHKPKFVISGAVTAIAVVAIITFSLVTTLSPASAEELTQQSLNKVSQLSPEGLRELDQHVNGDPKSELEAAKNAKDLQVLTYDQFKQLTPGAPTNVKISGHDPGPASAGPEALDVSNLKYLKYTDTDGATHIIAVNKDGLPVMIMVFRQNSDGSSEGSVQVQSGASGQMTTGISGQASPGAMSAGMTACSAGVDGKAYCTNSDGSAAPTPDCQDLGNGKVTCSSSTSGETPKQ